MIAKDLRIADYLAHIQEAIGRIQRYTKGLDKLTFLGHDMTQDAVIRNIEIIGEAANNIRKVDPGFAEQHADIPWAVMYAMRNRVSHAYHAIDFELVWQTIGTDLPPIQDHVDEILEKLFHRPSST